MHAIKVELGGDIRRYEIPEVRLGRLPHGMAAVLGFDSYFHGNAYVGMPRCLL
jgi:hypothetical protein